jgi:peptidoglycan/LPS O-acetylase OafA/YrhL
MPSTIAALLHGRDNNFNLIRFLAASAVIVDHSFALVAPEQTARAAFDIGSLEVGRIAVDVFFIVSGFLVTRSAMTRPTVLDYGVARFMRLFPALFVTCVAIAFVLGPLVTSVSLHDYFADPRPWLFVPVTASLITHSMTLPGVYDTLPVSGVIDQPLWTLRYESFCYILLALFALAGMLTTRFRAIACLLLVFAAYGFVTFATDWREIPAIDSTARFILGFFLGGSLYVFADKIRLNLGAAILFGAAAWLLHGTPIFEAALRLAMAYGLIWFALVPGGILRDFNRVGDYSYGLYILCFPIQQAFVLLDPAITPFALLISSFPAVLGFAVLSWHFVEHPALHSKDWASQRLHAWLDHAKQRATALFGFGGTQATLKTP